MLPEGYTLPPDRRPHALQPRYAPCHLLQQAGLPCAVWFEDAGAYHGVPTVLFDLHLLVGDIDAAAAVLADAGWVPATARASKIGNGTVGVPQRRLTRDDPCAEHPLVARHVVLLPAKAWGYSLPPVTSSIFPPLRPLIDALCDTIADGEPSQRHWTALHLAYLHSHVSALHSGELEDRIVSALNCNDHRNRKPPA